MRRAFFLAALVALLLTIGCTGKTKGPSEAEAVALLQPLHPDFTLANFHILGRVECRMEPEDMETHIQERWLLRMRWEMHFPTGEVQTLNQSQMGMFILHNDVWEYVRGYPTERCMWR